MYLQTNIISLDIFLTLFTLIYENDSKAQLYLIFNFFQSFCTNLIVFFDKQYNEILQRDLENDLNKKRVFSNLYVIMNHLQCFISSLLIIKISQIYYAIACIILLNFVNLYSIIAILHDSRNVHDETNYHQKIYFLIELSMMSIIISVVYNLTSDLFILNECIGLLSMYILSLFVHNFTLLQFVQLYGSYITYKFIKFDNDNTLMLM